MDLTAKNMHETVSYGTTHTVNSHDQCVINAFGVDTVNDKECHNLAHPPEVQDTPNVNTSETNHNNLHRSLRSFKRKISSFTKNNVEINTASLVPVLNLEQMGEDNINFLPDSNFNLKECSNVMFYTCIICHEEHLHLSHFESHIEKHTGNPPHTCDLCNEVFKDSCKFLTHLVSGHKNEALIYFCQKCDCVFVVKDIWHTHSVMHDKNCENLENIICTPEIVIKCELVDGESTRTIAIHKNNGGRLCCNQCGKIIENEILMNEHMKSHSRTIGVKRFECKDCKKKFSTRSGLGVHVRKHTQRLLQQCALCSRNFPTKSSLSQHMNRHLNIKPFVCNFCQKAFSNQYCLNNHILTHTGELPYQCQICGSRFRQRAHLKRHALKHGSHGPFTCRMCEKVYLNEENLIKHLNENESCRTGQRNIDLGMQGKYIRPLGDGREHNVKSKRKMRFCCGKIFYDAPSYVIHLQVHPPESFQSCKECGRKFVHANELEVHLFNHEKRKGKVQQCEDCGQIFKGKQGLIYHRMRYHLEGKGMIECEMCHKLFVSQSELKAHLTTHTGEKSFPCIYCEKVFRLSATLKIHTRIHSGRKDFKCEECGKCFTQLGHLKRHAVVHSGEKKYQCPICLRGFSQNGDLTKHIRIHTGDTPYVCRCGRKFNQKNSLTKHHLQNPGCLDLDTSLLSKGAD